MTGVLKFLRAFVAMISDTAVDAEAAAARLREDCQRIRRELAFRSIPASTIRREAARDLGSCAERFRAIADDCARLSREAKIDD